MTENIYNHIFYFLDQNTAQQDAIVGLKYRGITQRQLASVDKIFLDALIITDFTEQQYYILHKLGTYLMTQEHLSF